MLKPRALRSGDRLAVVAPASPFTRDEFDKGIAELRHLGFEPVYEDSVFDRCGYVAGDASVRTRALETAWRDPAIAGVIAVRGGYGSAQLLPLLDTALFQQIAKPLVGYSDITTLHVFLTTLCGQVAFHGPMLAGKLSRGEAGYDRESLLRVLMQAEPAGELQSPLLETIRPGDASGMLLGGTLTQILATLGTPYAFNPPHGYVLFVDEVGERPYRLDRMLTQLRLSGLLRRASGIVFGELPRCDEPTGAPRARAVVADLLRDFPGPVLFGFSCGHTTVPALTVPLGVEARIVGGAQPRVIIQEPAVESQ